MKAYKKPVLFLPFLLFFGLGCNGCLGAESSPEEPGSRIPASCLQEMPRPEIQKLDILFVIDNSGSMSDEQLEVQRQLPAFMEELQKSGGVEQSMHIGVISSSAYFVMAASLPSDQLAANKPSVCGILPNDIEIGQLYECPAGGKLFPATHSQPNMRVLRSDQPGFLGEFNLRVNQGVEGSPQETPFEAVRLALLSPEVGKKPLSDGGNAGFLRDGARLLIVVLSDEDDCSQLNVSDKVKVSQGAGDECHTRKNQLTPVREYYELFTQELVDSHGRSREVIWAAIAPVAIGTKETVPVRDYENGMEVIRNAGCSTSWGVGERHKEMAELFDSSLENLDSICQASYKDTLLRIARMANVPQYVDLKNIHDKNLVRITLTREDGFRQFCTVHNDGIVHWEEGEGEEPDRVYLSGDCARYPTDQRVEVDLLCAS